MELLGLSVMSLAVLMYGVVPLFADLNRTHATNPAWTAHARFHVVTQVLTTTAVAAISLWLLWSPAIERSLGICLAGALSDAEGGIEKYRSVDLNLLNFGSAAVLLLIGRGILL